MKNGLTPEDLEHEYQTGFKDGFKQAGNPLVRIIYATCMLVLSEKLHFGPKRIVRFMRALDDKLLTEISSVDAAEEVLNKLGIEIDFNEPFDRIEEVYHDDEQRSRGRKAHGHR